MFIVPLIFTLFLYVRTFMVNFCVGVSEAEELEVFKEQSNYDNLLMQLQSCNKDVAASCMKR